MKTPFKLMALTFGLAVILFSTEAADFAKGGGKRLIELNSAAQIAAIQKGDVVVTACPKCKTVVHTRVKATAKGGGTGFEKVASHGCPGCGAKVDVSGVGKSKVATISHVCSHCGSSEAFCSLLKKRDADK